jgi:hypothetical protein
MAVSSDAVEPLQLGYQHRASGFANRTGGRMHPLAPGSAARASRPLGQFGPLIAAETATDPALVLCRHSGYAVLPNPFEWAA